MAKNKLENIPLDQIRVNPVALREVNQNSQAFQELRDSIKARGVMNAIAVRPKTKPEDTKPYELIDGLQRYSASEQAGQTTIPAQILDRDEEEVLYDQIITNAIRVETRPAEYANGLKRIFAANPTMTESELAAKLHKSPVWINKTLSLNKLNDPIKTLVNENKIPLYNAYALASLPPEEQLLWLDRAQSEPAEKFVGEVNERVKAIRSANRRGVTPGEAKFTPIARFRKKSEVLDLMNDPTPAVGMIDANLGQFKGKDLVREAFRLALQWVVCLDPQSVKDDEAKWNDQRKKDEAERLKKAQERAEARAREVAQARKDIDAGKAPETITNPAQVATK